MFLNTKNVCNNVESSNWHYVYACGLHWLMKFGPLLDSDLDGEIVIATGLPILDLLDGSATGSRGGSSRNEIQAQGGVFRNGMGGSRSGQKR